MSGTQNEVPNLEEPAVEAPSPAPASPTLAELSAELEKWKAKFGSLDGNTLPDWLQRRLDAEIARRAKAEGETQASKNQLALREGEMVVLRTELAQAKGTALPSESGPAGGREEAKVSPAAVTGLSPQDFEAAVAQRAKEMLAQQQNLSEQDASAARGREAYGQEEFDNKIKALGQLGALPPSVLDIAMQTGAAEHVLFQMGSDLNLASQIIGLPPGAMAVKMAALTKAPEKAKPPKSGAPAPMTPPRGGVAGDESLKDDLPMEEWLARRSKQVKEKRVA